MPDTTETRIAAATDKLGYAVTYIQDYGGGRQVQIAFGLIPGAPKEALDKEFDKIRMVMDRQRAFNTVRDTETKLGAEQKMAAAIQYMMDGYKKEMQVLITEAEKSPQANQTITKNRINSMREQLSSYLSNKLLEMQSHQTNIEIAQAVLEGARKEIEE